MVLAGAANVAAIRDGRGLAASGSRSSIVRHRLRDTRWSANTITMDPHKPNLSAITDEINLAAAVFGGYRSRLHQDGHTIRRASVLFAAHIATLTVLDLASFG